MPRTASSQIQSRSTAKARPSANVRAGNLVANTPVLFRLPAIQTAPAQDLAITFSEAAAALPTATLAAVALSTAQPAAMPAAPVSEVSPAPQTAPQQTWWEHWSSGIVLIVLLIALATASILAWQGSNKGNSKLMADTKKDANSQNELSNIEVPKIDSTKLDAPKLELPASSKSNSYADKLESPSALNSATKSNDDNESSLIPSGSLSLTLDPPTNDENKFDPEPHATASLQSPVGKQQEPLFKDNDVSQTKSNISAQPASTSTQRSSTSTDKPSVWDNSKTSVHDTSKPLTLEFSSNDLSSSASSSAPASEPTSTTGNNAASSAKLVSQSTADAPSNYSAAATGTLVPKDLQTAAKTVTPEMNQAELFAAYRELKAPAAPTKVDNRYEAANASSQSQLAGATGATGTPASAVGYIQKSATQPNSQNATGSNNYTLQPTQSAATNAGLQPAYSTNNSSQPNQTPQYPNQTYQNPQSNFAIPSQQPANAPYTSQQLSAQQYSGQQYGASQYNTPQYAAPQYSGQQNLGQQNSGQQYSLQTGTQVPNSMQTQTASTLNAAGQGLQYGGAQVPYNSPASQSSGIQLPPGPIGGYGPSAPQYGTSGTNSATNPNMGSGSFSTPTSPSYPSMQ